MSEGQISRELDGENISFCDNKDNKVVENFNRITTIPDPNVVSALDNPQRLPKVTLQDKREVKTAPHTDTTFDPEKIGGFVVSDWMEPAPLIPPSKDFDIRR